MARQIPDKRLQDPTERLCRLADELRKESRESALVADTVNDMATELDTDFGNSLRTHQTLASGLELEMLMHPWQEYRWFYRTTYWKMPVGEPHGTPEVVCKWQCMVDYRQGVLQPDLEISMHVLLPEKLGRVFAYGMDISPGAKAHLCFKYQLESDGDSFHLMEVEKNGTKVFDCGYFWEPQSGSSIRSSIETPFPIVVTDCITREELGDVDSPSHWKGAFEVPYPFEKDGVEAIGSLRFPTTLRR